MKRLAILLALAVSAVHAQGVWINDAGTLREITGIYVNDGGTLREIQTGWVNDGGTLRQFYANISLSGGTGGTVLQTDSASPYDSTVGIRFNTNGTVESGKAQDGGALSWSSAGDWITPASEASSAYDVRFTSCVQDIGAIMFTTEAAIEDTWINLGAQRIWLSNKTTAGERKFTCSFEVRINAGAPPATGSSSWTLHIDNVI